MSLPTYAGNPSSYPAGVRYVEDGIDADEANTAPSAFDLADRTANLDADRTTHASEIAALQSKTNSIAAQNWSDSLARQFNGDQYITSISLGVQPFIDPKFTAPWLLPCAWACVEDSSANATSLWYSVDFKTWNTLFHGDSHSAGQVHFATVAADDQNLIVSLKATTTHLSLVKTVPDNVWITTSTSAPTAGLTGDVDGIYFKTVFIWGLYDGVHSSLLLTTTDGTTYTTQAFGSSPFDGTHIMAPIVWAKNSMILVGVGRTILMDSTHYLTSTDGVTFTERLFPAVSTVGLGESLVGVTWNDEKQLFIVASTDNNGNTSAGGVSRFYSSPDGTTWTLFATVTNLPGIYVGLDGNVGCITGCKSVGDVIVVTFDPDGETEMIWFAYSPDFGATWRVMNKFRFNNFNGTTGFAHSILKKRDGQFFYANGNSFYASAEIYESGTVVT